MACILDLEESKGIVGLELPHACACCIQLLPELLLVETLLPAPVQILHPVEASLPVADKVLVARLHQRLYSVFEQQLD